MVYFISLEGENTEIKKIEYETFLTGAVAAIELKVVVANNELF